MTKCRRCSSTILQPETCGLCGEPHSYSTYTPDIIPGVRLAGTPRHSRRGVPVVCDGAILLRDIRKFCAKYSFPATVFGRRFLNDANLVERLQNGTTPRQHTVEGVRRAMAEYEHNVDRRYG